MSPESIFSVRVYLRRTPRSRWLLWGTFRDGQAAADALARERRKGKVRGETLTVAGGRDPNEGEGVRT